MGNTLVLSQTLIITFGGMTIVLAILVLYAITLVVKLTRMTSEGHVSDKDQSIVQSYAGSDAEEYVPVQHFNEIDEEDRLVVALAASAMVANEKPNSHYRISKITRIK